MRGGALPETISSTIQTNRGTYVINDNQVTNPKGTKFTINKYEELNPKNQRDKQALQMAAKAGLEDPVRAGSTIIERKIAERAISQAQQGKDNFQANMKKNVNGYDELKKAISYNNSEHQKQQKSIQRGERIYIAKNIDIKALKSKYPRAAAYIEAENFASSSNHKKSNLGKNAQNEIRQGKSYKKAIKEMKDEWAKYTRSSFD